MTDQPAQKYRGAVPYLTLDGREKRVVQPEQVDTVAEARQWCANVALPGHVTRGIDEVHVEDPQ